MKLKVNPLIHNTVQKILLALMTSALCWLGSNAPAGTITAPQIQWQFSLDASYDDFATSVRQYWANYIVMGASDPRIQGNKSEPGFGGYWDILVVYLGRDGNKIWDRTFGTSGTDFPGENCIQPTFDGGLLIGGSSDGDTTSGNKTSPCLGFLDFWILRLDCDGNRRWDKTYGTTNWDRLHCIEKAPDNGFILGGGTGTSIDGMDWLVVRIDAEGDELWRKVLGGNTDEECWTIGLTTNGDFLLGGNTNGLLAGGGSGDYWLVKLDANGNKLWDKCYGGSSDECMTSLKVLPDGGAFLGGWSLSGIGGTKTSPFYGGSTRGDFWVVRIDADGNQLWDRSFGGTGDDVLNAMELTSDGGVILAGYSDSPADGNKTSVTLGLSDGWVVRLDKDGNKLWEQSFGGPGTESLKGVQETLDRGFVLAGGSSSGTGGNKTTSSSGFWIVKLAGQVPCLRLSDQTVEEMHTYGIRLLFTGLTNEFYQLEYSTNLSNWVPFQTIISPGVETEILAPPPVFPCRFYRAQVVR